MKIKKFVVALCAIMLLSGLFVHYSATVNVSAAQPIMITDVESEGLTLITFPNDNMPSAHDVPFSSFDIESTGIYGWYIRNTGGLQNGGLQMGGVSDTHNRNARNSVAFYEAALISGELTPVGMREFWDVFGTAQRNYVSLDTAIRAAFPDAGFSAEDVANLEIETFAYTPSLVYLILEARHGVVFSEYTAWTIDGQMGIINEDGSKEALPEFSELFPNWDLGQIDAFAAREFPATAYDAVTPNFTRFFRAQGTIHRQQAHVNAPIFGSFFNNTGRTIGVDIVLSRMDWPINGVNIGINNMSLPGQPSVGWRGNMRVNQSVWFIAGANATFGVRASTVDNSGFVIIDGFWW